MYKNIFYLLIANLILALPVGAGLHAEENQISIHALGTLHAEENSLKDGDEVFALVLDGEQSRLEKTKVSVTNIEDASLAPAGEKTGKLIDVKNLSNVLLLIKSSFLKAGPIKSDITKFQMIYPGQTVGLGTAWLFATALVEPGNGVFMPTKNYCIWAARREFEMQKLWCADLLQRDSSVPGVVWSGDLDRDGTIDVILDTSSSYNVSSLTLYLSSKAQKGKILSEGFSFSRSGC